jgi:hypothetical protein
VPFSETVLLHVTELRSARRPGTGERASALANGKNPAFVPFMTSTFRRV